MDSFNFKDIRNKIVAFLDRDMSKEEEKVLLSHIHKNPMYNKEYEQQLYIRNKIKEYFQRPDLAPGLQDKIRESISGKD